MLVTDLSTLPKAPQGSTTASAVPASVGSPQLAASRRRVGESLEPTSPAVDQRQAVGNGDTVGSGSWGWPGFNFDITPLKWGDEASSCPYLTVEAQAEAGFGAEWHFPMTLGLDDQNLLTVTSDGFPNPGVAQGGIDPGAHLTFYSAVGMGASFMLSLGCHVKLPVVDLGFLGKHGGETIGPDWGFEIQVGFVLSDATEKPAPLEHDQALQVPATQCITLTSDQIPGLGTILDKIHGPHADVPFCLDVSLPPTRMMVRERTPRGTQRVDAEGADLGLSDQSPVSVHFDQFDFAPKASSHLTVGLELGLTHDEGTSKHPTSGAKPAEPPHPLGKTFLCKDGTYSEAKHSQGACSSHGGIGQKLDPNNSEGLDPETGPDSLWLRLQQGPQFTVGPFTIPLGIDHVLDTTWEPDVLDLLTSGRSANAGAKVVTTAGAVGSLHFGTSRERDVGTALGAPQVTAQGSVGIPDLPAYIALGYECTNTPTAAGQPSSYPVGGSQCRTVYFINTQTQTLQGFWTSSSDYHTEHGTTVGMSAAAAQQREGVNVVEGCGIGITLGDNTTVARVLIDIPPAAGGSPQSTDTVSYIGSDSQQNSVGVLFC